jgi:hypothetical protein
MIISELNEILYLSDFREKSGCEIRRRCMVLQLINSFSAAQKVASPPVLDQLPKFKQVTFNAKAWRTSHPVRRDHHSAPELPLWAFPRFLITRHKPGDIINVGSKCGRGHGCLYARTSCVTWVSARTNLVPSVAVSLEARIALCTTVVEFVGLVEVEWRKMEMPIGMVLAQTLYVALVGCRVCWSVYIPADRTLVLQISLSSLFSHPSSILVSV